MGEWQEEISPVGCYWSVIHQHNISSQSVVQSYLEGVGWGLQQLREARTELKEVSHALRKAGLEARRNADGVKSLETLREISFHHCQLLAAVSNLPRLYSGEPTTPLSPNPHIVSRPNTRLKQKNMSQQDNLPVPSCFLLSLDVFFLPAWCYRIVFSLITVPEGLYYGAVINNNFVAQYRPLFVKAAPGNFTLWWSQEAARDNSLGF